jgi:hypothetical protein
MPFSLVTKNGGQLKIIDCNDVKWPWVYTADHRLALGNNGRKFLVCLSVCHAAHSPPNISVLCMDLEQGNTSNNHKVQTWECTDNDVNQVWTLTD